MFQEWPMQSPARFREHCGPWEYCKGDTEACVNMAYFPIQYNTRQEHVNNTQSKDVLEITQIAPIRSPAISHNPILIYYYRERREREREGNWDESITALTSTDCSRKRTARVRIHSPSDNRDNVIDHHFENTRFSDNVSIAFVIHKWLCERGNNARLSSENCFHILLSIAGDCTYLHWHRQPPDCKAKDISCMWVHCKKRQRQWRPRVSTLRTHEHKSRPWSCSPRPRIHPLNTNRFHIPLQSH